MHHIAILRKSNIKKGDNLLKDIIDEKKTIESRWYINKINPWDKIKTGDLVYFKESGKPINAVAIVTNVIQFSNLNEKSISNIISEYGSKIAPSSSTSDLEDWKMSLIKSNKNYCILVFLDNVKKVTPFNINKKGYGIASAWITVEDVNSIKS